MPPMTAWAANTAQPGNNSNANHYENKPLGNVADGALVEVSVDVSNEPGLIDSGTTFDPGGWSWLHLNVVFQIEQPQAEWPLLGFVDDDESASHRSEFRGTWHKTGGSGSDGNGGQLLTWEMDVTASVGDAEVSITGIENKPPNQQPNINLSPKICANAQDHYKKAKWKVVVKPVGTTASITTENNDIISISPTTVSDGDIVEVTATGNGEGTYKLNITHDDVPTVTATGESTVFRFFVVPNNDGNPGGKSSQDIGNGPSDPSSGSFDPIPHVFKANGETVMDLWVLCDVIRAQQPIPNATVSEQNDRSFKVKTNPANMYSGKVQGRISYGGVQTGNLQTVGLIGVSTTGTSIALSGVSLTLSTEIGVSGSGIQTSAKRTFSRNATAPNAILATVINADVDSGSSLFDARTATFTVGSDVTLKAKMEMTIDGTAIAQGFWTSARTMTNEGPGTREIHFDAGEGLISITNFAITP